MIAKDYYYIKEKNILSNSKLISYFMEIIKNSNNAINVTIFQSIIRGIIDPIAVSMGSFVQFSPAWIN